MVPSPVDEDTLKAIYYLQTDGDPPVATSAIAESLGKTQPTATSTLDRLEEQGLIRREPYRGSELTDEGETVALEVIRHHRLIETYLAEQLDYPWDRVHDEAERLEHHISEEFETRVAETLGDPQRDPHGDPIPGENLEPPSRDETTLSDCDPGERGVIARVADDDDETLAYLADIGITPETGFRVTEIAPIGTITLEIEGKEQTVPDDVAAAIAVSRNGRSGGPADTERRGDA